MSDSRSFFEKLTGSVRVEETPAEPIEEVAEEPEQEFEVRAAASSTAARPKKHAVRTIPVETESSKKSAWPEPEEAEGQLTVDIFDTGDYIVIQSTVAGVDPENLDISYTDDMVTIRGKRERMAEAKEENYYYKELYWGSFSRSVILPEPVDADKAEATLKNGILTIRLPKRAGRAQKIKVKAI